jgi:XapX domain-containing protein
MIDIIKSLGTGIACGIVFSLLNLPIPAPGVFAGIVGIIGIFLGYILVKWIIK